MTFKNYYGRFTDGSRVYAGFIVGDQLYEIRGDETVPTARKLADLQYLAPVVPSKIVCVGLNYTDHAAQSGNKIPPKPLLFLKAPTSIIAHNEAIVSPSSTNKLCCEGELAVIIGKKCRHATKENALDYVFGYTCANDVSARDLQRQDGQWARAKSFDSFCPIGPGILITDEAPDDWDIEVRVNDKVWQHSSTKLMGHNLQAIIAHASEAMTLLPGDIILTGTPGNTPELQIGDTVYVEIANVGTLANPVIAE
jgi:2-keto-4-pentenoate hydratase/2-oxohepta-3-ene-1,7-dioic acid hydratase in catechol pathway